MRFKIPTLSVANRIRANSLAVLALAWALSSAPLHAQSEPALRLARESLSGPHEHLLFEPTGAPATRLQITPEEPYTSGEICAQKRFNELLLSWNADTPADAGFCVEIQVGREARGDEMPATWSPWLYIGDWNRGVPKGERRVEFEGGKVEIDVFRSKESYECARFRVRPLGGEIGIARLAVTFSDTSKLRNKAETLEIVQSVALSLPVPERRQYAEEKAIAGRICSPTSVAMVLAHYGAEHPTAEVAQAIFDADHDIYGNWPRAVQAAWAYGVPGWLERFGAWSDVASTLAKTPIIASIRVKEGELTGAPYPKTNGHLIVLVGFDENGDVVVNDPAARPDTPVRRTYSRSELETVWIENGGVAYVLQDPDSTSR